MDSGRRLAILRTVQRLLDEAFRIPGTRVRVGWDAIIGLIPLVGDAITAALAAFIVVEAARLGVPRVVQLRMIINVGLDVLIGLIPLAGDVADVFWRANTRNMQLLERHAAAPGPARAGDWLFVGGVCAVLVAIALLPLLMFYAVVRLLTGA